MRTLSIEITDSDFSKFGLKKEKLSFAQLVELVSTKMAKNALNESVRMAEIYSLSDMSMEDINNEISAARLDAKNNS